MQELSGKTALVTGASRGIGEAAARMLALFGANVVLMARTETAIAEIASGIRNGSGAASHVAVDVAIHEDVERAVAHARTTFGAIDILVNNAGIIDPIARLADSDPKAWGQVVDVNLMGVYHGLRAVLPVMEQQGHGVIVNLSSGAATGALEGWSHYCATKAAVLSLTKCAQKELGDKGVRIVGLSPGTVATEMQVEIRSSGINPVSQLDPSAHIPANDAAHAICWLCTADAVDLGGTDFSIKTPEGRARCGLPAL